MKVTNDRRPSSKHRPEHLAAALEALLLADGPTDGAPRRAVCDDVGSAHDVDVGGGPEEMAGAAQHKGAPDAAGWCSGRWASRWEPAWAACQVMTEPRAISQPSNRINSP
jgi:hypothetical protein